MGYLLHNINTALNPVVNGMVVCTTTTGMVHEQVPWDKLSDVEACA